MRLLFGLILLVSTIASAQREVTSTSVYFDLDKFELRQESKIRLDEFIKYYKQTGLSRRALITLKGFCDSLGSLKYNDLLSQRRVFAVHNYLLNNGLPKKLFTQVKGYGERLPVNDNATDEERQLNRRVDISYPYTPPFDTDTITEIDTTVISDDDIPPSVSVIDTVRDFTSTSIDSVKEGEVLRLKNINFYGGRHTMIPQSTESLKELLEVMKKYPTLIIEIQGHICCKIGSPYDGFDFDTGEDRLSVNRARAIYYYLIENGIEKKRMTYRGFAAMKPLIYPERNERDRLLNRRVEIKIIKK